MLLSLDGLMESVAPLAAFHNTTGLLVNNLHLTVHHHILIVAVEHGVGLEQLLKRVGTLALNGVVAHQLVFLLNLLLFRNVFVLKCREFAGNVGEHKEFLVVHLL